MKYLAITLLCILAFCSCRKEYTIEVERIEIANGKPMSTKDFSIETIKAANDAEAAKKAYSKYVTNIIAFCMMQEHGSSYLWLPIDYKVTDSSGRRIHEVLSDEDISTAEITMTKDYEDIYVEWLGIIKYNGTPYGVNHPRQFQFD